MADPRAAALQQLPRIGQRRTLQEEQADPPWVDGVEKTASEARSVGPNPMASAL